MGATGTIIAQRVALSSAPAVPPRISLKSLGVPERLAAFKSMTAAGTIADRSRAGELPRGLESLTWSSAFSSTANVTPVAIDRGSLMTKTDDALSSLRESIARRSPALRVRGGRRLCRQDRRDVPVIGVLAGCRGTGGGTYPTRSAASPTGQVLGSSTRVAYRLD